VGLVGAGLFAHPSPRPQLGEAGCEFMTPPTTAMRDYVKRFGAWRVLDDLPRVEEELGWRRLHGGQR